MKKLFTVLFVAIGFMGYGQTLSYSDGQIEYEDQMVNTINIKLSPKPSTVRSSFEDWMDDKYDVDLDGKTLLFFDKEFMKAEGVVIPEISNKKIDLIVKVDETMKDVTTLHVFASFGYDNWITLADYPFEFLTLESIVYEYVAEYLPEYYMERVEESKEALEDLEEKRKDLEEERKENEEKIMKLKKENEELATKLRENQQQINATKSRITKRTSDYKSIDNRVKNK